MRKAIPLAAFSAATVLASVMQAGSASAHNPSPAPEPSISASTGPEFPENPDDWQPPADWEEPSYPEQGEVVDPDEFEGDLPVPGISGKASPAPTMTTDANPDCKGQWAFKDMAGKPQRMGRVGPSISSYFGNGGDQTLTAGVTGSIAYSFSQTLDASAKIKALAEVKLAYNATANATVTVTASVQERQPVPKGYWGNAFWGRFRVVVTGTSYQLQRATCKVVNQKRVTMYAGAANKAVGWCKWVSKNSLGSRPAVCNDGSPYIP